MARSISVNVHSTIANHPYTASVDSGQAGSGTGNGGTIKITIDGVADGTPWLRVQDDQNPAGTKGQQISVSDASTSFDVHMSH